MIHNVNVVLDTFPLSGGFQTAIDAWAVGTHIVTLHSVEYMSVTDAVSMNMIAAAAAVIGVENGMLLSSSICGLRFCSMD